MNNFPKNRKDAAREYIHRWAHPQGDQNEVEKCNHDMDWLQKCLWYGPANLDKKLSENGQNIK